MLLRRIRDAARGKRGRGGAGTIDRSDAPPGKHPLELGTPVHVPDPPTPAQAERAARRAVVAFMRAHPERLRSRRRAWELLERYACGEAEAGPLGRGALASCASAGDPAAAPDGEVVLELDLDRLEEHAVLADALDLAGLGFRELRNLRDAALGGREPRPALASALDDPELPREVLCEWLRAALADAENRGTAALETAERCALACGYPPRR